jgi:O-antigen ligase
VNIALNIRRPVPASVILRLVLAAMLIPIAAVIGRAIAHEQWLMVGAALFIPIFLLWPIEVSLGMFAFSVPFESVAMLQGSQGTTLSWLAGAVAGGGLLAVGIVDGRLQKPPRAALWWTLFIALGSASILWAYNPDQVLQILPTALCLYVLYLAAVSVRISERELFWITTLAIAGGVLASVMSISGFYSGISYENVNRSTIASEGLQSDPNMYAAGLLLPLSLAIGRVLSSKSLFHKLMMGAATAIIGVAILLTMSRGALLALCVMMVVYAVRYRLSWKILAPVGILSVGLTFVPSLFFSRLQNAVATGGAGRVDIWTAGLHAAKRFGIIGAGLNNFPSVYTLVAGYAPKFQGFERDAHNIYLATLVELGIAGLLFMLFALWAQLRDASPGPGRKNGRQMAVPAEAALWGILISAIFVNLLYRKCWWLTLIVVALAVKSRRDQEDKTVDSQPIYSNDVRVLDTGTRITTAGLARNTVRR